MKIDSKPFDQALAEFIDKRVDVRVEQKLREALKPDEYLSPSEAAKVVHRTKGTICKWVKRGKLTRFGGKGRALRISRNELERLMKNGGASNDELSVEEMAAKRFG